jgi:predicted membrane chloride channel (bestrophin family)
MHAISMISVREREPLVYADNDRDNVDKRGPVTYQSGDHMAVLFQRYGSIWLKVLPYCIVSALLALFIGVVGKGMLGINVTFNDQGHMFMSIMVSVLMVSRSRIACSRYMEARGLLATVMRSCRELTQYLVTFTRYDNTPGAIEWREHVCSCTIGLLCNLVDML